MTTDELIAETLRHDAAATAGPWDAWESARETYVRQRAATDGAVIAYADAHDCSGSPPVMVICSRQLMGIAA